MDRQLRPRGTNTAGPTSERKSSGTRSEKGGHHGKFATAINCMDGRVQLPVINWMKQNLSVDYVDMITEAGPDKILAEGAIAAQDSIKGRVLISVNKHGSETILIAAHHDCAGNPVPREEHERQVRQCVAKIRSWKLPVKTVLGAWIDDRWRIKIVKASD